MNSQHCQLERLGTESAAVTSLHPIGRIPAADIANTRPLARTSLLTSCKDNDSVRAPPGAGPNIAVAVANRWRHSACNNARNFFFYFFFARDTATPSRARNQGPRFCLRFAITRAEEIGKATRRWRGPLPSSESPHYNNRQQTQRVTYAHELGKRQGNRCNSVRAPTGLEPH
jgi:hypothetical protein